MSDPQSTSYDAARYEFGSVQFRQQPCLFLTFGLGIDRITIPDQFYPRKYKMPFIECDQAILLPADDSPDKQPKRKALDPLRNPGSNCGLGYIMYLPGSNFDCLPVSGLSHKRLKSEDHSGSTEFGRIPQPYQRT